MMSHLIAHAILPQLKPRQIDFLAKINFETGNFIKRNRLVLPRTHVEELDIQPYSAGTFMMTVDDNDYETVVSGLEMMDYLKQIKVRTLKIGGHESLELFEELWLKDVESIEVSELENANKDIIERFLKKTSCSKLSLLHSSFELDATTILESMPCVESLVLENANFTDQFFKKLSEKTKFGAGLENLELIDWNGKLFNADVFTEFLKTAKFRERPSIWLFSNREALLTFLTQMRMKLNVIRNWKMKRVNGDVLVELYQIITPNAKIDLWIEFEDY